MTQMPPNIQKNVDNLERSGGLTAFLGWTKPRPQVQRRALNRIFLKGGLCGKCLGPLPQIIQRDASRPVDQQTGPNTFRKDLPSKKSG